MLFVRDQKKELFTEIFETKIKQGQKATNHLHEHLKRTFFDHIERTKAKLLKQLNQYSLIMKSLNLGNPLEELMQYCNDVKTTI